MAAESEVSWDEIERRAALQRKSDETTARNNVVPLDDSVHIGDVEDERQDDERRYNLGLANIDPGLGPLLPAGFTVAAALPGHGKTSLLEQVADANSKPRVNGESYSVFVASLEMLESEIRDNLVGREMGVELEDLKKHRRIGSKEFRDALEIVRSMNLRLWRPPIGKSADIKTIFQKAERAQADMLLIDYTKLLDGWSPGNEAAKIVQYIAAQTKFSGMHVLLLAQLNTDNVGRRPTIANMEDTKALNQASEKLILIHRPFALRKTGDDVAELIVAKNRKGKMFRGHVHWYGPTHTFYTMTREEEAKVECCKPRTKAPPPAKMTPSLVDAPPAPPEPTEEELFRDTPF